MATIILIIHLMIALALVAVILLQRSEGGALGIGGGGGGGGFLSGRGQASLLTRTTAFLALGFISTSFVLAILASRGGEPRSILEDPGAQAPITEQTVPAEPAAPSAPVAE